MKTCPRCGRELLPTYRGLRCRGCQRTPNDCRCDAAPCPTCGWPLNRPNQECPNPQHDTRVFA